MDNQALFNNCKRFVEISELDPEGWTEPVRAEYQELLNKLQSGHSIVINNGNPSPQQVDQDLIRDTVIQLVGPGMQEIDKKLSDLENFLGDTLNYKGKGGTF